MFISFRSKFGLCTWLYASWWALRRAILWKWARNARSFHFEWLSIYIASEYFEANWNITKRDRMATISHAKVHPFVRCPEIWLVLEKNGRPSTVNLPQWDDENKLGKVICRGNSHDVIIYRVDRYELRIVGTIETNVQLSSQRYYLPWKASRYVVDPATGRSWRVA